MPPRPTTEQFSPPAYAYDVLDRPTERQSAQQGRDPITDHFGYNQRSELTSAQVSGELYGYDYDNIGNRRLAFGGADYAVYTANELNQYTQIDTNGNDFTPEYDADGNQTLVQTGTGIWRVTYNAQNRAVKFEREDGNTVITCAYDYMGRRIWKKVTTDGTVTLHERYIYRNYLQIAAVDLLTNTTKHAILWDPTHPTATRPLAIQQAGTWYTYGWDLTKNITELYGPSGYIRTLYTYTPYGAVTAEGDVSQPIQWSSEYHDTELSLVYYNYRYYNPVDGRWTRRDDWGGYNLYSFVQNRLYQFYDLLGLLGWSKTYKAMDEDLIWDSLVGKISLILVTNNNPIMYSIKVQDIKGPISFKDRTSSIEYHGEDEVIVKLGGIVEAHMNDYANWNDIWNGIASGAGTGAEIGAATIGGFGAAAGGMLGGPPGALSAGASGALVGSGIGGLIGGISGGIAGALQARERIVSLKISLTLYFKCNKEQKEWQCIGLKDESDTARVSSGDLYLIEDQ